MNDYETGMMLFCTVCAIIFYLLMKAEPEIRKSFHEQIHRRESMYYNELQKIEPTEDEIEKIMYWASPITYRRSKKEGTIHLLVPSCSRSEAEEHWRRAEAKRLTDEYYKKHPQWKRSRDCSRLPKYCLTYFPRQPSRHTPSARR